MREAGEKTSGEETMAKKLAKKGFLAALIDYGKRSGRTKLVRCSTTIPPPLPRQSSDSNPA
jgi:hypothetical protein